MIPTTNKVIFEEILVNEEILDKKTSLMYEERFENKIVKGNLENIFNLRKFNNFLKNLKTLNHLGLVINIGFIILSYSFSESAPDLMTSSLRVVPFRYACLAILADLSPNFGERAVTNIRELSSKFLILFCQLLIP